MFEPLYRAGALAAYQVALVLGILLMPLALFARQLGVTLPVGDLVTATGAVYDRVAR